MADIWTSRVVWKMPFTTPQPMREGTGIATLQINKLGVVIDCAVKVKSWDAETSQEQCWSADTVPPLAALEMRGYGEVPMVEVDMEWSSTFSSAGRDRLMQERSGFETRSLLVFRLEINTEGQMIQCVMERQRGSEKLITNLCLQATKQLYAPVKDATGTPVSTTRLVCLSHPAQVGAISARVRTLNPPPSIDFPLPQPYIAAVIYVRDPLWAAHPFSQDGFMLGAFAKSLFGSSNDRYVKSLGRIVGQIGAFEPTISALTDAELVDQTRKFRERLSRR